jgi:hypothetical protein
MRLAASNGDSLTLRVAGYEFPHLVGSGPQDWDANWLVVEGHVRAGEAEWTFRDPCLTTWEARTLASWLHRVADGAGGGPLEFTEPCLAFSWERGTSEEVVIRIRFAAEALPNRGKDTIELTVACQAVSSAAADWDAELEAFPVRG